MKRKHIIVLILVFVVLFFPFKKTIHGWGMVVAPKDMVIRSLFEGVVKSVPGQFGMEVKKGETLLKVLLVGTSDDELREALTRDNISMDEMREKEKEFEYKKVPSDDLDYMKLKSDFNYLQKESEVFKRILGNRSDEGAVSYDISSPIDGKIHLLFPKASVGNFIQKNDDLFTVEDPQAPKQLLCVLNSQDIDEISKGDIVESVPVLNWEKGILRLTATASDKKLNRDQLESYMVQQPEVFDILFKVDGSRQDYWGFLANDLQCNQLENLPAGMLISINVDKGFTDLFLVIGELLQRGYYFVVDYWG